MTDTPSNLARVYDWSNILTQLSLTLPSGVANSPFYGPWQSNQLYIGQHIGDRLVIMSAWNLPITLLSNTQLSGVCVSGCTNHGPVH